MKTYLLTGVSAIAALALTACAEQAADTSETAPAAESEASAESEAAETGAAETASETNPLLAEWEGPYGGVPAFDQVEIDDFVPALETAMDENRAEWDAIANNPDAPTFENTILPLEQAGSLLGRVSAVYGVWGSNLNSPDFQAVQREMAPKFSALADEFNQNQALFERVEAIYEGEDYAQLSPVQQRLVWDYYTDFVRAGAKLGDEDKARVAEINQELASLQTQFSNNLLHDEEAYVTWLEDEDLAGLPDSVIAAARSAADNHDGEKQSDYAILNTRSSMDPFLTYSDNRALREQVWRTYYSRGDNGGEYDNNQIISDILRLREERSRLQGYETFADRALEKRVAKSPANAMDLMMKVWPAAVARVDEEVAEMQAIAEAEGADITIQPWDYRYYAEKVRLAKYDLDANEVKNYLQLDNLVEGMFWMAGELFGHEFTQIDNIPVFHEDVTVYEVTDRESGEHIGLWYFDPFARAGKRSGAWMTSYRVQNGVTGATPIVSNNSNFIEGEAGEPVLISWDDANTLFHEFGHALHGLISATDYPSQAGTAVARDYVEFPSQVFENWLGTPEILNRYALHYETGEPIPQALVDKIEAAATFRQGFDTTEYLASALVDMRLHTLEDGSNVDVDAFERQALEEIGMPDELPMRHRLPQFAHLFSSEGYAASYYSYLWADTFGADAWEAFAEAPGGAYDPDVAERFETWILSVGDSVDPVEAYSEFRGRDVDTNALMRQRGFPTPDAVDGEAAGDPGMDVDPVE